MENYNVIILSNTGIKITESMRNYVNVHVSKIRELLSSISNQSKITTSFKKDKDMITFEIMIKVKRKAIIRAKGTVRDYYDAVDIAFEKIRKNIRNYKEKHSSIDKKIPNFIVPIQEGNIKQQITRVKNIDGIAMSQEAALTQLEILGHDFFLFLDNFTLLPCVVYKRINEGYGILKLKMLGE